jgi:Domain of unknown function (DUF6089)
MSIKVYYRYFLALICALGAGIASNAQVHEAGLSGGLANYKGELAEVINYKSPGPYLNVFYRANFNRVWSFRLNFSLSRISADDSNSNDDFALARNHSFKNNLLEFSGQFEYNFLNFRSGKPNAYDSWTPYLFSGIGMAKLDPIQNAQPNYSTWSAVIPLGVGIKMAISERINLGIEFGSRFTFTDYLDDLGLNRSKDIPPSSLNPKYYTGNTNDKDMYFFTGASLSIVIPNKGKNCPIKVPN